MIKKNLDFLTDSYKNNFNFEIGINQSEFPTISGERKFSPMDRSLRRELKSIFGNNNYWFSTSKFKNAVEIKIKSNNDVIEFLVPKDIDEMEKMLNDYLQFAKTQAQEKSDNIELVKLFKDIRETLNNDSIKILYESEIYLKARPLALKRSFENIIQNGLTYGKKVFIKIQKSSNLALISIEDDGPGIPEDQYKNVFKPFFRLDKSRSLNQSGVGLGLAIVEDVIHSHGGNIQLSKSKYKGLQVKISLPF